MRYTMLICEDPDAWESLPPEQNEAAMRDIFAWFEKWGAAGKISDGGAELQHPRTGRTARQGDSGVVVTDGPYLELKEVVAGVVFLEADDLDDAMAVATTWPGLSFPSTSVEVRPVVAR